MNVTTAPTATLPANAPAPSAPPAPAPTTPGDTVTPAPPQDPFLHKLLTLRDAAGAQKFQQALTEEIKATAGGAVQPWRTPHVEKAAFPFQVDKQARIFSPQAAAQVSQNLASVVGLLANPEVDKALLLGAETRLDPNATPVNHDLADPDFRKFYNAVRTGASDRREYEYSGTLVNVGWGAGDHVNVSSDHLPAGPNTVSGHLAGWVTSNLTQGAK